MKISGAKENFGTKIIAGWGMLTTRGKTAIIIIFAFFAVACGIAVTDTAGSHHRDDHTSTARVQDASIANAGQLKPRSCPATFATDKIYKVTAYCPCEKCCGKWAKFRTTASGHKVDKLRHFVAMDRSVNFGTMVNIPGYATGQAVPVLDRGGAIKGNRIDVYFDSHKRARRWGVRHLPVRIEKVVSPAADGYGSGDKNLKSY